MTLRNLGTNTTAYVGRTVRTTHAPALGLYFPEAEGALGDGTTDDTTAMQAAADTAAAAKKTLYLDAATYKITSKLGFSNHLKIIGQNGGAQTAGGTKILWAGSAGGTMCGPKVTTGNTVNVQLQGVWFSGATTAGVGVSLYRTSYSRLADVYVDGMDATTGVGFLLDGNVSGQCYFNVADNCKVSGAVGVRFQNGANANRWNGGKIGNGTTGMEFLSASAGNIIEGVDLESSSVKHVYIDAQSNVFLGLHMEDAPIGFDITVNGVDTRRFGTTLATSVITYLQDASVDGGASLDRITSDTTGLRLGSMKVQSAFLSSGTTVNVDPYTATGSANAVVNFLRNVNTSGTKQFILYKGDGTNVYSFLHNLGDVTLSIGQVGLGGGKGVLGLVNRTTLPVSPTGGGTLFAESGAARWCTPNNTYKTIAGDVLTVSASTGVGNTSDVVLANGGASGITLTLPTALKGMRVTFKKIDAAAGAVTIATTSSQTIDGVTTKVLSAQYDKAVVVSDGSNWFLV